MREDAVLFIDTDICMALDDSGGCFIWELPHDEAMRLFANWLHEQREKDRRYWEVREKAEAILARRSKIKPIK